jgi:AbrB family looped-hinge helix DNA binding protein
MPRSKVTAKYQVTIPKEVREKVDVRPGEMISMEVVSQHEIVLRRYPKVTDPLKTLIGGRTSPRRRAVPIEELEERIATRML